jgi:hypothetical protein
MASAASPAPHLGTLRRPSVHSLGREGYLLEQTFGRYRPAGAAEHVDEGTQRDRHLPVARIVEEEPVEGRRPVL